MERKRVSVTEREKLTNRLKNLSSAECDCVSRVSISSSKNVHVFPFVRLSPVKTALTPACVWEYDPFKLPTRNLHSSVLHGRNNEDCRCTLIINGTYLCTGVTHLCGIDSASV